MKKSQLKQLIKEEILKVFSEIKVNNPEIKPISIHFTPEPFKITFYRDDFESDQEYINFKRKLISDNGFAFETFFDNIYDADLGSLLNKQNENNWVMDVREDN